jgi:hypothetical protein
MHGCDEDENVWVKPGNDTVFWAEKVAAERCRWRRVNSAKRTNGSPARGRFVVQE